MMHISIKRYRHKLLTFNLKGGRGKTLYKKSEVKITSGESVSVDYFI